MRLAMTQESASTETFEHRFDVERVAYVHEDES